VEGLPASYADRTPMGRGAAPADGDPHFTGAVR
jgi:hypothetical protein